MKESDLYQPVKKLLENQGYQVYAEVTGIKGNWSARADVIGYDGTTSCIVEMKTSLSMELIEQAYMWLPHANYVYICIPRRKKKVPIFVRKILHQFGIGIIEYDKYYESAHISMGARFNRPKIEHNWSTILLPEHQTWVEGGSISGGHVTPYKLTMTRVRGYLSLNPHRWFSIKEILDHCETHYASPKPSLSKALREFEHTWCETKKEGGKLWYRIKT